MPDDCAVRRERRHRRLEAVHRRLLLVSPVACVVGDAERHRERPRVQVRRRSRRPVGGRLGHLHRGLHQGRERAHVQVRGGPLPGRGAVRRPVAAPLRLACAVAFATLSFMRLNRVGIVASVIYAAAGLGWALLAGVPWPFGLSDRR